MAEHHSLPQGPEGRLVRRLRIHARARRLKEIRDEVQAGLLAAECPEAVVGDVVLAVDEACQNIIRHAYGGDCDQAIILDIRRHGPEIIVTLRDFAEPVNVDSIKSRDLDEVKPGGLGVHLIRQIMDDVTYTPLEDGEGNILRLTKRIE